MPMTDIPTGSLNWVDEQWTMRIGFEKYRERELFPAHTIIQWPSGNSLGKACYPPQYQSTQKLDVFGP
jgi:hypothetical protein